MVNYFNTMKHLYILVVIFIIVYSLWNFYMIKLFYDYNDIINNCINSYDNITFININQGYKKLGLNITIRI